MPAERRKKTKTPEEVPGAGHPERKRVLNILAQRRYRQRQRERIAALEAQAGNKQLPQLLGQDGGVQPLEDSPALAYTTSSEPLSEGPIEEIVRNTDGFGFPEMNFGQCSLDMSLFGDSSLSSLPSTNSIVKSSQSTSSHSASPPSFKFPLSDDAQLHVPTLKAIRAFASIAVALDINTVAADPNHLHVLPPIQMPNLPWNLQPTPAQLAIPHHPVLDLLPWPSVRERLICLLSLPSMCRPLIAQDDDPCSTTQVNAIHRLTHDLDDFQEGTEIHGNGVGWDCSGELLEDAWEMGESFFRRWWFCIDENAVITTNRRRRERGVRALQLKG